jgi:hypothetical protein
VTLPAMSRTAGLQLKERVVDSNSAGGVAAAERTAAAAAEEGRTVAAAAAEEGRTVPAAEEGRTLAAAVERTVDAAGKQARVVDCLVFVEGSLVAAVSAVSERDWTRCTSTWVSFLYFGRKTRPASCLSCGCPVPPHFLVGTFVRDLLVIG